jgi:hypothetical protein
MTIDDEEMKQSSPVRLNENVRISRHQHHQQQQNEVKGGGDVSSSSSSSLFHTESFFPSALQTHHYHDAFGPGGGGDEGVDYGPPNPYDDDDSNDDGNDIDNDNDRKNETEFEKNHFRSNNNLKSVTEEAPLRVREGSLGLVLRCICGSHGPAYIFY